MLRKHTFLSVIILLALGLAVLVPSPAFASSACGTSYMVQWRDTLGAIGRKCGTSVAALRLANPSLGYWLYAGQTLWLPGAYIDGGGGYATYIVARGDTLKGLAARFDTTMSALGSLNSIANYDLIYEGQRLAVPDAGSSQSPQPAPQPAGTYVVQWGDTLRKIAARLNVSPTELISVNPQIWNPSLIYVGQVIYLPDSASLYTIQRGDTLRLVAARFDTTVDGIVALNPQIRNADRIYAGNTIRIR